MKQCMITLSKLLSTINTINIFLCIILIFLGAWDMMVDTHADFLSRIVVPASGALLSYLIFFLIKQHQKTESSKKIVLLDLPLTILISGPLYLSIVFMIGMTGYTN